MQDLIGKTAVVTGGGSGIGMGMCRVFARAGMQVVVADIEGAAAKAVAVGIQAEGGSALSLSVDVSSRESVEGLAESVQEAFGCVHLLCNNAGVWLRRRGIHATHEDWVWMLGVNLWGVVHGVEMFLPKMLRSGDDCHIVNTSSINGIVPSATSAMYSAGKYGVTGLTETLYNELAGTKVGISVLCPGLVESRLSLSERNRPSGLAPPTPTPAPPHVPSGVLDLSPALEPDEVGELTLTGVRENALYIFTDIKTREAVLARHHRMMAAFDELQRFETRN